MNLKGKQASKGFTPIELVLVVVVLMILGVMLIPAGHGNKARATRIQCVCNLKQVGLAYRTWALDGSNSYPMSVWGTNGGSRDFIDQNSAFKHYIPMSNELSTPKILWCPTDKTRVAASTFDRVALTNKGSVLFAANTNLSYFVGVDANENLFSAFLSGDRWIGTGTTQFRSGLQNITSNAPIAWINSGHEKAGNVGLADGSVQQLSNNKLTNGLASTGLETNHLEFP